MSSKLHLQHLSAGKYVIKTSDDNGQSDMAMRRQYTGIGPAAITKRPGDWHRSWTVTPRDLAVTLAAGC